MQTELAQALERLEAITKPADSALFSALVKYDQEACLFKRGSLKAGFD